LRKITLGHLAINAAGKQYVNDALDNNRLSAGKYTARFESEFAALHGCQYGVFCNSGTSALQIALAALKEEFHYMDGDEVIVPATTFIATSNVILQNGLKPVFVDVDPLTFNMDPEKAEAAVTSKTRCIIPVHLFGLPAEMVFHRFHGLQVLEDSCETAFASIDGYSVGSFGDLACFSNYIAHLIVGGVGGLVTTNNDKLAKLCRSLMAHGRDDAYTNIDMDDEVSADMISRRYSFDRVGYSYRATEMEAAIALSELEHWERNITQRRANAIFLTLRLEDLKGFLQLPHTPAGFEHSFMMYAAVLAPQVDRGKFLLYLEQHGIETRLMFPLLESPIYRKLFPGEAEKHPVSHHLSQHGFFIGCHQGLNFEDMQYVSDVIHKYFYA
jgi:perosamine synthetase